MERQQLKWFTYAAAILAVLIASSAVVPGLDDRIPDVVGNLSFAAVPMSIGVAILRFRLYDIDRIINRTLVYGLLTALLGGVYAGAVLVLGQLFGGIRGQPPNWVVAGATLAVAALFRPARRHIQAVVDRRFNRRKYDAATTIETFSAAFATSSSWTPSRGSCSPWPRRRWSQRRCPCGFDHRTKSPNRMCCVGTTDQHQTWSRYDFGAPVLRYQARTAGQGRSQP